MNNEQQKAFNILKKELVGDEVLRYFDPTGLVTDASGIGGVLLDKDSNNEIHPSAYISRSLNNTELKYSISPKKKLFGVSRDYIIICMVCGLF